MWLFLLAIDMSRLLAVGKAGCLCEMNSFSCAGWLLVENEILNWKVIKLQGYLDSQSTVELRVSHDGGGERGVWSVYVVLSNSASETLKPSLVQSAGRSSSGELDP